MLSTLGNIKKPKGLFVETVVVVDGSSDGTIEMIEQDYPSVHIVTGTGNWWYTRSMNEGFRYALKMESDIVLTLNDDIILPDDYLTNLFACYQSIGKMCVLGSVSFTHNTPHRITNSGIKEWNRLLDKSTAYFPFLEKVDPQTLHGVKPSPVLPGRGMLIPRKILEDLQLFDEKFIQYHSDFDFTLRARKRGYEVFICWDAKIFSFLEKTASGSSFLKSSFRSLLKNFSNPYGRSYVPDRSRYYWRHAFKALWPFYMMKFLMLSFKNHFFKIKVG